MASESYRKRKAPSGTKTDHIDAWGLADALRVDGHGWKTLQPMDPLTHQLRLLCQDEVSLIQQRTGLVNQLQQALVEYYPAALEAFEDWTNPSTWDFIIEFPTPQGLVRAGKRRWEKFPSHPQTLAAGNDRKATGDLRPGRTVQDLRAADHPGQEPPGSELV